MAHSLYLPLIKARLLPPLHRGSLLQLSSPCLSDLAGLSPLLHDAPFSMHIIERLTLHALGFSINSFMSYFFAPLVLISHWDFLDPQRTCGVLNRGLVTIYGFAIIRKESL